MRVLWFTMALNLANAGLKLVVGLLSANLTVVSDAVHGFLDASNNVMGLLIMRVSWRPPDARHPYGHRKAEALAALGIGALMVLISWEILKKIAARLTGHAVIHLPAVTTLWLVMVGIGLAINIFIAIYEERRGRRLSSMILLADAAYTRSDIMVSLLSLASLALERRLPWLDPVLSAVVVLFILYNAGHVVRDNVLLLTDSAQLDTEPIRRLVESIVGVENCHAIRTHGMPDEVHLDLHIVVAPQLNARNVYDIETRVRNELMRAFPQIWEVAIHHQTHAPRSNEPLRRRTAGEGVVETKPNDE
ncbi:MAG: cation diffusion facilitator family transporter [bacterium]|nr:cation diffusion facilitator family transporter [bacterium]